VKVVVAFRQVHTTVARADFNLVGLAMRAERKVIDKIVDGLKFHGLRVGPSFETALRASSG
jgi:hypothetical protein